MKTTELIGPALDYAVAICEGWNDYDPGDLCEKAGFFCLNGDYSFALYLSSYSPSTLWPQGGPIIEHERIELKPTYEGWAAFLGNNTFAIGPTPLIAAMRTYVASKLGDKIEIPEKLL